MPTNDPGVRADMPKGAVCNPTTRTGRVIHAPAGGGYPLCGQYIHGILYTDAAVNCPGCLAKDPATPASVQEQPDHKDHEDEDQQRVGHGLMIDTPAGEMQPDQPPGRALTVRDAEG